MNENTYGVKKVDVFNDIVSRLEDGKKARVSDDVVSGMKNYYDNKQDYRNRVNMLADNLKGVKPIDSEVNNVIYLSNYVEKGIAIKTSIISFKQIWVEYRLIFNENLYKEENEIKTESPIESTTYNQTNEPTPFELPSYNMDEPIQKDSFELPKFEPQEFNPTPDINLDFPKANFNDFNLGLNNNVDDISMKLEDNYNRLYNKVAGISTYVENYNQRKMELDRQIAALEEKKAALSNELRQLENAKLEFSRYKEQEENKLKEMKNDVNNKVVSLQNLIDNLDNILGKIN